MFENYTFTKMMDDVLNGIPDSLDKREGSIIYDALAPAVVELSVMYQMLDEIIRNSFGDTADREYLVLRAAERGLSPQPSTKALLKVETLPIETQVPVGTRFSYGALFYTVTEKLEDGKYKVECDTYGTAGNKYKGPLVLNDYVEGLKSAEITELITPGEEEEDTETFRKRYLGSFKSEAFGGNIDDYKEKVNAIEGVGGVKVLPHTNAAGEDEPMHVKILIINSEYTVPSEDFVADVQKKVDPDIITDAKGNILLENRSGYGEGIAPIGHFCHVEGAPSYKPVINFHITYAPDYTWETVEPYYNAMLDAYFLELNKSWESSVEGITLRRSQIESRILDLPGVLDVTDVTIDGESGNKQLTEHQILVRENI